MDMHALKFCLAGQVMKEQVRESTRIHGYFLNSLIRELNFYLHGRKLSGPVDIELETIMKGSKEGESSRLAKIYDFAREEMVRLVQNEVQDFCRYLSHALIRVSFARPGTAIASVQPSHQAVAARNLSPADRDLLVGGAMAGENVLRSTSGSEIDFRVAEDGRILPIVRQEEEEEEEECDDDEADDDIQGRNRDNAGSRPSHSRRYKSGHGSDSNLPLRYSKRPSSVSARLSKGRRITTQIVMDVSQRESEKRPKVRKTRDTSNQQQRRSSSKEGFSSKEDSSLSRRNSLSANTRRARRKQQLQRILSSHASIDDTAGQPAKSPNHSKRSSSITRPSVTGIEKVAEIASSRRLRSKPKRVMGSTLSLSAAAILDEPTDDEGVQRKTRTKGSASRKASKQRTYHDADQPAKRTLAKKVRLKSKEEDATGPDAEASREETKLAPDVTEIPEQQEQAEGTQDESKEPAIKKGEAESSRKPKLHADKKASKITASEEDKPAGKDSPDDPLLMPKEDPKLADIADQPIVRGGKKKLSTPFANKPQKDFVEPLKAEDGPHVDTSINKTNDGKGEIVGDDATDDQEATKLKEELKQKKLSKQFQSVLDPKAFLDKPHHSHHTLAATPPPSVKGTPMAMTPASSVDGPNSNRLRKKSRHRSKKRKELRQTSRSSLSPAASKRVETFSTALVDVLRSDHVKPMSDTEVAISQRFMVRRRPTTTTRFATYVSPVTTSQLRKKAKKYEDTAKLPKTVRSLRLLRLVSVDKIDPADSVDGESTATKIREEKMKKERKLALEEAKESASKYLKENASFYQSEAYRRRLMKARKRRERLRQREKLKKVETFDYDDILPEFAPTKENDSGQRMKYTKQSVDFMVMPAERIFDPRTGELVAGSTFEPVDESGTKHGKFYLDDVPPGTLKSVLRHVLPKGASTSKDAYLYNKAESSTSLTSGTSEDLSDAQFLKTYDSDFERLTKYETTPMRSAPYLGPLCRKVYLQQVERYQDCLQHNLLGNTKWMRGVMLKILEEIRVANRIAGWKGAKEVMRLDIVTEGQGKKSKKPSRSRSLHRTASSSKLRLKGSKIGSGMSISGRKQSRSVSSRSTSSSISARGRSRLGSKTSLNRRHTSGGEEKQRREGSKWVDYFSPTKSTDGPPQEGQKILQVAPADQPATLQQSTPKQQPQASAPPVPPEPTLKPDNDSQPDQNGQKAGSSEAAEEQHQSPASRKQSNKSRGSSHSPVVGRRKGRKMLDDMDDVRSKESGSDGESLESEDTGVNTSKRFSCSADIELTVTLQEKAVISIYDEIGKSVTGKYKKAQLSKDIPAGVVKALANWKEDSWNSLSRLQALSLRNSQAILRNVFYRALELGAAEPIQRYKRKKIRELDLSYFQLQKLTRLTAMPSTMNTQYLRAMKAQAESTRKLLSLMYFEESKVSLPEILAILADERAKFFAATDRFLMEKSVFKSFREADGITV